MHQTQSREGARQSTSAEYSFPSREVHDCLIMSNVIEEACRKHAYRDFGPIQDRLRFHLDQLRASFPNLKALEGKRILDLACGSRNYTDDKTGSYEPWMCRLLLHLGAKPLGVDLTEQRGEAFDWKQADLTEPNALDILKDEMFDAAYICAFPTRKAIHAVHKKGLSWPDMREEILSQVTRRLNPGGIIIRQFGQGDEELVRQTLSDLTPPQPSPLEQPPGHPPRLPPWHFLDDD